jgi:hypothetical protein
MKSFIAKQQRMSLTKAYCSSDATGPKDWDLKQQKTKGGKHTNGDKADYPIGFHGRVSLVVRLCLGWERLLWRRQAFDDVLRTTGYLETVPGASSESWA